MSVCLLFRVIEVVLLEEVGILLVLLFDEHGGIGQRLL